MTSLLVFYTSCPLPKVRSTSEKYLCYLLSWMLKIFFFFCLPFIFGIQNLLTSGYITNVSEIYFTWPNPKINVQLYYLIPIFISVGHSCTGSSNLLDNHDHECEQWGTCHGHGKHWHCIQGTCRCFAGNFNISDKWIHLVDHPVLIGNALFVISYRLTLFWKGDEMRKERLYSLAAKTT